ncbi:hypothetical protein J0J29_24070, partial [Vibrio vulnificus]|uniref:hypothetical protein n=1 Tax=Vibrio vulnificus TaxID=672 RepID=UPI0019D42EB6
RRLRPKKKSIALKASWSDDEEEELNYKVHDLALMARNSQPSDDEVTSISSNILSDEEEGEREERTNLSLMAIDSYS